MILIVYLGLLISLVGVAMVVLSSLFFLLAALDAEGRSKNRWELVHPLLKALANDDLLTSKGVKWKVIFNFLFRNGFILAFAGVVLHVVINGVNLMIG